MHEIVLMFKRHTKKAFSQMFDNFNFIFKQQLSTSVSERKGNHIAGWTV